MKTYGLIGKTLGHSFSKDYFTKKFEAEGLPDCVYQNFELAELAKGVGSLKILEGLCGLNVTIPYKTAILDYLDEVDEVCSRLGACNCIRIKNSHWKGFNTDVPGFEKSIKPLFKPYHNQALVFGTGGASKAVVFVLEELGIGYQLVSRKALSGILTYQDISPEIIREYPVLINTTPVGMSPYQDGCIPIPYEAITTQHLAYDLIYNPEETLFLKKARQQGAVTKNGLEMLMIQAEESWKIWNG